MRNRLQKNTSANLIQIVAFELGNQLYAFDIDSIKEVVLTGEVSVLPKSPDYVAGVSNIRGNVLVIIDLEVKFKLKEVASEDLAKYIIIVEHGKHKLGILINKVPNTIAIEESSIDRSMDVLDSTDVAETFVEGIVKHGDDMIIKVDAVSMMEHDDVKKMIDRKKINK